jgi:hypothetical protein
MKMLGYLAAGLLACPVWTRATPDSVDVGHLSLSHGIRLEYEAASYPNDAKRHENGPIGPVFGIDGGSPHTVLKRLTVEQGEKKTSLDVSYMYDPWFERLQKSRFKVRIREDGGIVLTGIFSDAAGSYVAEWLIVDGVSVRTLLSNEPSVIRSKLLLH